MPQPAGQARLTATGGQNLKLFSEHFFDERLPEWRAYRELDARPLMVELRERWEQSQASLIAGANEAQTEDDFIKPVLRSLGFESVVQTGLRTASGRLQPDYALFLDKETRDEAAALEGAAVFRDAIAVADAKRFDRPLQGRTADDPRDPAAQIINYVLVTKSRWGVLTNGRLWRLYAAAGDLLDGACYEVDLVGLIELGDAERFREFAFFFSADSLRPDSDNLSTLDRMLAESIEVAEKLGESLEDQIFEALPLIATGLLGSEEPTREALDEAFEHGLVLLYRLLFCLHAEDRGLLPVASPHFREYSLRRRRTDLAADLDRGRTYSRHSSEVYDDLRALFRIVDEGDKDLGVNEYDGGLFSAAENPYFEGRSVPDPLLAPALDRLFRVAGRQIDFRDLSTRHLGTIYERLLAYQLEVEDERLVLAESPRRKYTGSYFTPRPVVDLIVERTLEPILVARSREIAEAGLVDEDALERFLELKILDPAMGSAHFLVAAAAYVAVFVANDPSYDGGLSGLELQRRVAERSIYGVDLIAMAVELANFSIWLSTIKGDAPLTYLSNLRVGDSLVGVSARDLKGGDDFFTDRLARDAGTMLAEIRAIEHEESSSGDAIDVKRRRAATVAGLRAPLTTHADESIQAVFPGERKRMFHWPLEYPEAFVGPDGDLLEAGGFDVILGNPPYIRIQELGRDLASYCRDHYESASGSFDAYTVFVERALSLLAPGGRLGFIVPNKFTKLDSGAKLRGLLARERAVAEIIDFGDARVFAEATNYTCILCLNRDGAEEFSYRKLPREGGALADALNDPDSLQASSFSTAQLDGPWILATPDERAILAALEAKAIRLEEATDSIFTGLQTSADPVYILEDRGRRGANRLVYSKASDRVLELEPDLLHPLASGVDVDRFAFNPLGSLLIFPYKRAGARMRLLTKAELEALPLTQAYLGEHEGALRGREHGKMDHSDWFAYVYPKSLGKHDLPKLGCAATVAHLEVAADPEGVAYFHNVRVNGILPASDGPSLWTLLLLLNSRPVDWYFRRIAAEHANGYFAANKQFIAPLPIRVPDAGQAEEVDKSARDLHGLNRAVGEERAKFLEWLGGMLRTRVATLSGKTKLYSYESATLDELLDLLRSNRDPVRAVAGSRGFRETFAEEFNRSVDVVTELRASIETAERRADDLAFELYELSAAQRAAIEGEYER